MDAEPSSDGGELLRAIAAAPPVALERAESRRLMPGTVVDGVFRIEGVLGAGAMGVVYEAVDLQLDRRIALKLHTTEVDDARASRMWREARALARLAHPNVITVHDVGTHEHRVYIAMELVDGGSGRDFLRSAPPGRVHPWREVLRVFVQAAAGLAAAHAVGLVHRDFKPENMLLGEDGRVRVADFGLAMTIESTGSTVEPQRSSSSSSDTLPPRGPASEDRLTRTGASVGTPAYMAPEQTLGLKVDHRCDQFAFCVALYEALYGVRPYAGIASGEALAVVDGAPPRGLVDGARVPRWLHGIVIQGLALAPGARFAAMDELVAALKADPGAKRRRLALGLGIATSLCAAVLATRAASVGPSPCQDATGLEDAWTPEVAAEIEGAMTSTGSPLTAQAVAQTVSALDHYAERFDAETRDACEATRVLGTQSEAMLDRRMTCLQARRQEVVAVTRVLRSADADVVERTPEILGTLGSIDACGDTVALETGVAPPEDPRLERVAVELQGELAGITAEVGAGRAREIRGRAEATLQQARTLGHPHVLSEAQLVFAQVLDDLVERDAAIDAYVAAHHEATRAGRPREAWRSSVALARLTGQAPSGTAEALRWLRVADGWAERFEPAASDRARMGLARAEVLKAADRYEEAEGVLRSTLETLGDARDPEGMRAQVLAGLGIVEHRLGHYDRARERLREALRIQGRDLGEGHPRLVRALTTLAQVERSRGDAAAGSAAAERALAIVRERRGEGSLAYAVALRDRGDALGAAGRLDDAVADYERALTLLQARGASAVSEVVFTENSLANLLASRGQGDAALVHLRRGLDAAIPVYGTDSMRVALLRVNIASAMAASELDEEVIAETRSALPVLERELGPTHVTLVGPHLNIATSLTRLERFHEAHAALDTAAGIVLANPEGATLWEPRVLQTRGAVLEAQGRTAEAMTSFHDAVERLEASGDPSTPETVRARMRWADLVTTHGDPNVAVAPLRRTVADAEAIGMAPVTIGRARLSLARALVAADPHDIDDAREHAEAAVAILASAEPDEGLAAAQWLASLR